MFQCFGRVRHVHGRPDHGRAVPRVQDLGAVCAGHAAGGPQARRTQQLTPHRGEASCQSVSDYIVTPHILQVEVGHPSEVHEIFDFITYYKGASVIRMLYNWIGG